MENDGIRSESDTEDNGCETKDDQEIVIRTAKNYLKKYALTKGHSLHSLSQMPPDQLADYLKDFYTSYFIKPSADETSVFPTLKYIRTGLHRYFLKSYHTDIVKDEAFDHANNVFDIAARQAPRRCHKMRIEYDDLKKIYLGPAMNLDHPDKLQNKVFFDVNLYICSRGKDFLRVMSKTDFVISTDKDGRRSVYLRYHPKFTLKQGTGGFAEPDVHQEGEEKMIGQKMIERPGDPRCPVSSFLKYLTHLHPMTEAFWQRPKRHFVAADYVWYDNTPLGNSTLSKIMTRICQLAGLFENYTNHSIRPAYISTIEGFCKEALKKNPFADGTDRNSPMVDGKRSDVDSPVTTDSKDSDDSAVGLKQAKMKVLEVVHGLEVKNLSSFVEWMKTFRIEKEGGGIVVLCNTVEHSGAATSNASASHTSSTSASCQSRLDNANGRFSRDSSPGLNHLNKEMSPAPLGRSLLPQDLSRLPKQPSENDKSDPGIEIRQVEFDSVGDTHCSVSPSDLSPVKITIPSQNTVLLSGLQDSNQVLVHNREGPPLVSEGLQTRIFSSQHQMDIAVVTALLSTRNSIKNFKSASSSFDKTESTTRLEDKYKPVKKRSLSDLHVVHSAEDYELYPRKRLNTGGSEDSYSGILHMPTSSVQFNNSAVNLSSKAVPGNIQPVPVMTQITGAKMIHLLPNLYRDSTQAPILPSHGYVVPKDLKIKSEPKDH